MYFFYIQENISDVTQHQCLSWSTWEC